MTLRQHSPSEILRDFLGDQAVEKLTDELGLAIAENDRLRELLVAARKCIDPVIQFKLVEAIDAALERK